jgi:hypothetical protein
MNTNLATFISGYFFFLVGDVLQTVPLDSDWSDNLPPDFQLSPTSFQSIP